MQGYAEDTCLFPRYLRARHCLSCQPTKLPRVCSSPVADCSQVFSIPLIPVLQNCVATRWAECSACCCSYQSSLMRQWLLLVGPELEFLQCYHRTAALSWAEANIFAFSTESTARLCCAGAALSSGVWPLAVWWVPQRIHRVTILHHGPLRVLNAEGCPTASPCLHTRRAVAFTGSHRGQHNPRLGIWSQALRSLQAPGVAFVSVDQTPDGQWARNPHHGLLQRAACRHSSHAALHCPFLSLTRIHGQGCPASQPCLWFGFLCYFLETWLDSKERQTSAYWVFITRPPDGQAQDRTVSGEMPE